MTFVKENTNTAETETNVVVNKSSFNKVMDKFEIVCNWNIDDDKELDSLIVCSPEKKGIESVTAETCICLIPKNVENDSSPQKPELEIKSKHPLKELNVYSEASLIEVFGVHGEYLCTCKAEFIDDWEGLAVYHANIKLPGIITCTLKLTRIREKNRLWLYSIQPTTVKSSDLSNHRLFSFQNFVNLLSSSPQIPEKAEEVKKLVEDKPKTSSTSPAFRFQSLLNVTNRECNSQFQDCKNTLLKCLNSSGFLYPSENSSKDDMSKNQLVNEYVINYIDRKFIEMKTELMNQMEINLAQLRSENNAKLDKIMKLIESARI